MCFEVDAVVRTQIVITNFICVQLMTLKQDLQAARSTCQGLNKEKDGLQQALMTTQKRFSDLEMQLQDAFGQKAALEQQVLTSIMFILQFKKNRWIFSAHFLTICC